MAVNDPTGSEVAKNPLTESLLLFSMNRQDFIGLMGKEFEPLGGTSLWLWQVELNLTF